MPRTRRKNRPHPPTSITTAITVPEAIHENNAGRPINRLLLAEAMGYSPSSSGFRDRIASSAKYGLTEGNFHSEEISLTDLGVALTRPRNAEERIHALRNAFRQVDLFSDLLDHFANRPLPEVEFLKNTVVREPFSIDPAWAEAASAAFTEDARCVGFLRDISGKPYILLEGSTAEPAAPVGEPKDLPTSASESDKPSDTSSASLAVDPISAHGAPNPGADRPPPMQIFIAHGKNRKPLEQLKNILNMWKVPYLVAVDEPNAGRPISIKVAEIMRASTAGVFLFTGDEEFQNELGTLVKRPSENVIYELGAASLLYGQKIVILKEAGVTFPSDFSDLGWIEFEKDSLEAKAMDLLREMISLDALRLVSPTSS